MTVAEAHETAETHHGVGDASRQRVDHEVIDLADVLPIGRVDRRSGRDEQLHVP